MYAKKCSGFFLFCLDNELFAKIKKTLKDFYTLIDIIPFTFLLVTQDLNKI